jgi:hypothetical protein
VLMVALVFLAACSSNSKVASVRGDAPSTTTMPASPLPPAGFLSAPPSGDRHTLVEWGWDGRQLRALHLSATVDCCTTVFLSPDGTRLLVIGVGDDGEILDLQGHLIAKGPDIDGSWADDSRHLCSLQPHARGRVPEGPADLLLIDPGRDKRVVAQVPGYGPHTGPSVLRCSIRDNEVIVAENTLATNVEIRAVRISTGAETTPRWAPPRTDVGAVVAVSGNGRYALEQLRGSAARGHSGHNNRRGRGAPTRSTPRPFLGRPDCAGDDRPDASGGSSRLAFELRCLAQRCPESELPVPARLIRIPDTTQHRRPRARTAVLVVAAPKAQLSNERSLAQTDFHQRTLTARDLPLRVGALIREW